MTILLWVLLGLSLIVNGALVYGTFNMIRKNEKYEEAIVRFYNGAVGVLATARAVDNKNLFESDDEVGILFQELLIVIGELRELIYAEEEEEVEYVLDAGDARRNYQVQFRTGRIPTEQDLPRGNL